MWIFNRIDSQFNSLMQMWPHGVEKFPRVFCLFCATLSSRARLSDADQSRPALEPLQRFVHLCCSSLFFFNLH